MKNLWNKDLAKNFITDIDLRVYSSNLLGQNDELVLHGGGNTSVKSVVDGEDILYVKGSGWDLISIKAEGFAPVKLNTLKDMAKLDYLSDTDMVSKQKEAMIDKSAPNPSVEAILHAIIPFKFVDHTHADAVVTISNSKDGIKNIQKVFPNFLIIPYIMPGFILAQKIYEMSKDLDWNSLDGIILHNHGIFTFDNDAKISYTKMIDAVTKAEIFLDKFAKIELKDYPKTVIPNIIEIGISFIKIKGSDSITIKNQSEIAKNFASQKNLKTFATRGVLTPEHILRTKRVPLVLEEGDDLENKITEYTENYKKYFKTFAKDEIMLDPNPNWIVLENFGIISFGKTQKEAQIIDDIVTHTMKAVLRADKLGGYQSISLQNSFDMEYWELEQNKLKR
jgi:rhamnose utilization protein RhaD (predicted bifunctional aldolase and dehydrogenase)